VAVLPGRYRRQGGDTGELEVFGPDGFCRSTFTCAHCQRVVFVTPGCSPVDLGGLCPNCNGLICPCCAGLKVCNPWEKQMEKMEARSRFLHDAGLE
jgi:hypothetical protein